MLTEFALMLSLLWGTLVLRPYVAAFLAIFIVAAWRDLGPRGTLVFLGWGWLVAFTAEYASTRIGLPFGLYRYTEATRGLELYVANVPFFSPLSFPFLAYAAFSLARKTLGPAWRAGSGALVSTALMSGILMMLLDVVIDPLAVRGERWFLGHIFDYPDGGIYFGVPVSNFIGWTVVGWAIVVGALLAMRGGLPTGSPRAGIGLYGLVLVMNLLITLWIQEVVLAAAGIVVHAAGFLVLYFASRVTVRRRVSESQSGPPVTAGPTVWRERGDPRG